MAGCRFSARHDMDPRSEVRRGSRLTDEFHRAGRSLEVVGNAKERLRARVVNHNEGAPYVISAPEGGMLHNLNRYWYAALKRAKIADLHFHDLRHTFASRYMMAGGDFVLAANPVRTQDCSDGPALRAPR